MVSVMAYSPAELILVIILTYVALGMVAVVEYMCVVLNQIEFGKGSGLKVLLFFIGGSVALTAIYQFPVRIGTVMFFFGGFFGWMISGLVRIVRRWKSFGTGDSQMVGVADG